MIRVFYKSIFKKDLTNEMEHFLSFSVDIKNNELPIVELSWEFIYTLIKNKLKSKIYLIVGTSASNNGMFFDFLKEKK